MAAAIGIVVFMAIVVGIAAGILFLVDRVTLRSSLTRRTQGDRRKRTHTWQRRWGFFYVAMAAIALVVNALNLDHESLKSRIGWSVPAALVVIWFLLSKGEKGDDEE